MSLRISIVRKIERGHAHLQILADAVAISVRGTERGIREGIAEPFGIDARAFGGENRRQV